ncbi:hypothetical protein [Mycolicibacter heraklionensis]|uniref:hypothetical protein n=1 Tax=Mycolicibacter heraklionensis TaxID=512402 RepID=UPI00069CB78B|nr:hypothetical protein [Mycolicibacter heraklionensis]
MDTLSMQDIADLAGVARSVVTIWRDRYAQSHEPFPAPVTDAALVFDAAEVAEWLRSTRRGNNPQAADDAVIYSSLLDAAAGRLDDAALLLLLHAKAGEPLKDLRLESAFSEIAAGREALLPLDTMFELLDDDALVDQVDRLAEAGFSAAHVLARLVGLSTVQDQAEMLTKQGERLLHRLVTDLARDTPGAAVPWRTGGLMLVNGAFPGFSESELPVLGIRNDLLDTPWQRATWRSLDAAGASLRPVGQGADLASSLIVGQWAAATSADSEEFFDWVGDIVVELAPGGRAIIVGPAALLVDPLDGLAGRHRFEVLASGEHYVAPLRYIARLPKGMCRTGGRRRLAVWVLAPTDPSVPAWTVYADHSDHALNPAEIDAMAADVVAAVTGPAAVAKHSFLRSDARSTEVVLRRHLLSWPVTMPVLEDKGAVLARIWDLDMQCGGHVIEGIEIAAAPDEVSRPPMPWGVATKGPGRLARVIKGVRLPVNDWHAAGSGTVAVIGPKEIQGQAPLGGRRIDRLTLESTAPRARFTEPGDVVFLPTGTPQAIVDRAGGSVVQAPARVIRSLRPGMRRVQLLPEMLAADINAQRGTDTTTWAIRTIPVDECGALRLSLRRSAARRAALEAELAALDALDAELADGLSVGALTARIKPSRDDAGRSPGKGRDTA